MKTRASLSRPIVPSDRASQVDLMVAFEADAATNTRRPLNVSLVIDHSGSMAGAPLKNALKAAKGVVDHLHDDDRVSVVIYDDTAKTIVPSQPAKDKSAINAQLSKVHAAGCTNLAGGVEEGAKNVRSHHAQERVNRVLLLTDGQANVGTTQPDALTKLTRDKAAQGITTTTLGFGTGFNEDLLIGMAAAGEGNFYFIQSPEDAEDVFRIEVEGLSQVAAQDLVLTVTPAPGVKVLSVLNSFRSEKKGDALELVAGDVYANEPRRVLLELAIEPGASAGNRPLVAIAYRYKTTIEGAIHDQTGALDVDVQMGTADAALASAPDPDVATQTSRARVARVKEQAIALADKGDFAGAAAKLRGTVDELRSSPFANAFEIAEEIDHLDHYAQLFDKRQYHGDLRKELRDQSYQATRRGRSDLALRGTSSGSATGLEVATSDEGGVVLKCVKEGGKLRIHVAHAGYDSSKNVQFPRAIRQPGVTYLAESVTESSDGAFYRVTGKIKRLVRPGEPDVALTGGGGSVRRASSASAKAAPKTAADLASTDTVGTGVLVQCVKEGSKLRARVVSDGFNPDWNIRFPRSIRELGVLYVVDEVTEAGGGGSYVASGDIKRLIQ